MTRRAAEGPRLNRLMTLEAPVESADGAGGRVTVWTALGQLWAALGPSGVVERALGEGVASLVTHRVTLRWRPHGAPSRPTPAQRLRQGARVFEILGVAEADAFNERLVAWVREGSAA